MPRPASDKRERLSAAAAELVASHGLDGATIAAIANLAKVPPGSVFYYLATKADVADAAVASWTSTRRAALVAWEAAADPRARLTAYLDAAVADAPRTVKLGTIGTLAAQLRATAPSAADAAAQMIRATVDWAAAQFRGPRVWLGCGLRLARCTSSLASRAPANWRTRSATQRQSSARALTFRGGSRAPALARSRA